MITRENLTTDEGRPNLRWVFIPTHRRFVIAREDVASDSEAEERWGVYQGQTHASIKDLLMAAQNDMLPIGMRSR